MFRFPYWGYPYYYNYYSRYSNNNHSTTDSFGKSSNLNKNKKNANNENQKINNIQNKSTLNLQANKNTSITTKKNISSNTSNSRYSLNNEDSPIFEILGIKLYSDDIIILCLLFFLYKEKVHDEILYIILFLLLFA